MSNVIVQKTPQTLALEINLLVDQTRKLVLSNSILIGQKLKEAKDMMTLPEYNKWVETSFEFGKSTANNLLRLYEEYGADQGVLFGSAAKSDVIERLSYTQAVMLLSVPAEEREKFIQTEKVEELSTRELKAKIAEMKAAKDGAEEEGSRLRESLQEEQERSAELSKQHEKVQEKLKKYKEDIKLEKNTTAKQEEEIQSLEKEIAELKKQLAEPAAVAVER